MVRLINKNFFSIVARHIFEYPTPSNINYFWGLGSISGLLLVLQVLSGAFLAIYYESESTKAFESVQNIMDNVLLG
jgi:ubiquinol-cytochrome c reductase cytochrome b subunit